MTHDAFSIAPRLAESLLRADDGRPPYELAAPDRPVADDVDLIPADAAFVAIRGTATSLSRLGELRQLIALWANPASPALFRACAESPSLRALYVVHFKTLAEIPIGGAPVLEHLMLGWAPKLRDLSFLAELPALRTVYLEDMKRIDLSTLPSLPRVTGLHLGGGMWSALRVESLEPLTRLPSLRYLRLPNVRVRDGSLRPLAALAQLRDVHLPNFFAVEEYARLAAALPRARGSALTPFFTSFGEGAVASTLGCKRCGGQRTMMTGKPALVLCPACDAAAMQRRVERWERAQRSPWP